MPWRAGTRTPGWSPTPATVGPVRRPRRRATSPPAARSATRPASRRHQLAPPTRPEQQPHPERHQPGERADDGRLEGHVADQALDLGDLPLRLGGDEGVALPQLAVRRERGAPELDAHPDRVRGWGGAGRAGRGRGATTAQPSRVGDTTASWPATTVWRELSRKVTSPVGSATAAHTTRPSRPSSTRRRGVGAESASCEPSWPPPLLRLGRLPPSVGVRPRPVAVPLPRGVDRAVGRRGSMPDGPERRRGSAAAAPQRLLAVRQHRRGHEPAAVLAVAGVRSGALRDPDPARDVQRQQRRLRGQEGAEVGEQPAQLVAQRAQRGHRQRQHGRVRTGDRLVQRPGGQQPRLRPPPGPVGHRRHRLQAGAGGAGEVDAQQLLVRGGGGVPVLAPGPPRLARDRGGGPAARRCAASTAPGSPIPSHQRWRSIRVSASQDASGSGGERSHGECGGPIEVVEVSIAHAPEESAARPADTSGSGEKCLGGTYQDPRARSPRWHGTARRTAHACGQSSGLPDAGGGGHRRWSGLARGDEAGPPPGVDRALDVLGRAGGCHRGADAPTLEAREQQGVGG